MNNKNHYVNSVSHTRQGNERPQITGLKMLVKQREEV